MMFNQGYSHPMDRDYHTSAPEDMDTATEDVGFGVADVGQSVPLGIAAADVQGVASKIRMGAGNLEIGFPGAVRGQRQAQTPGMWGKDTRQALKELAKVNEVKLTTHSSYGIMGLSGQDQQGNFSKEQRKLATDEIKRAVEFAADTAEGGSVVVHTGEFERPISEEEWAQGPQGATIFSHYDEEPEKAVIRVVDDRTGQVMDQVRKNRKVARPIWNTADSEYYGYEFDPNAPNKQGKQVLIRKGDYIDYEGNLITNPFDPKFGRVPKYDEGSGRFMVKHWTWDDFVKDARERNEHEAQQRGMDSEQFRREYPNDYILPEEAYLQATLETNEGHSRGWALQYGQDFDQISEGIQELKEKLAYYEKLETDMPESERWKLRKEAYNSALRYTGAGQDFATAKGKLPSEIINDALKDLRRKAEFTHQASVSQEQQAEDAAETRQHIKSARKYALEESRKAYAEAAIHAMDETKQKNLENPLVLTMENIFPDRYGGHPEELKNLIRSARKEMETQLINDRKMNPEEARQASETHIKATIDTGHLNLWRKYFTGKEEDFKKWMLGQVEELAKEGMVGNIHLTDNFGYQDDHLAPGSGNTPVLEIAKILKKYGYEGPLTVEPGADASTDVSDFHGLMKTWRLFGSSVYGMGAGGGGGGGGAPGQWSNIQYSYFGQNRPPYFVFGAYSPSNDWTLWTQVPME